MLKVLIVDDEILVRIGIKSTIGWEENGFTVVGEAKNGLDALQKIEELSPDILLTDIRMPKMDGIELLKEIDKKGLAIESVIMSCYNEFELVREAMKYGASDYLLKVTFSEEDLLTVLSRIREKKMRQNKVVADNMLFSQDDFNDKSLQKILDANMTGAQRNNLAENLKMCIRFDDIAMLMFCADLSFKDQELAYEQIDITRVNIIYNMIEEYLTKHTLGNAFIWDRQNYFIIAFINRGSELNKIAVQIQKKIQTYLNLSVSMGMIDYDKNDVNYEKKMQSMKKRLLEERYVRGHGVICTGKEEEKRQTHVGDAVIRPYLSEIRGTSNLTRLPTLLDKIIAELKSNHLSQEEYRQIFNEVFYSVASILPIYKGSMNDLNRSCGINLAESLQKVTFLCDIPKWFDRYAQIVLEYVKECEENNYSNEVQRVLSYLQDHYDQQITLPDVAKEVGLSTSYFSTMFKKMTGKGFVNYLTMLRIEKAKELLCADSVCIYEICQLIGYQDASYFSRIFKKVVGMSPEQYRKTKKRHF